MILVDTAIWVEHLNSGNEMLAGLLEAGAVLAHPVVIAELALGALQDRTEVLATLRGLPRAVVAAEDEVLHFIEENGLAGLGLGHAEVHLLAAARLTPGTSIWTREKRLQEACRSVDLPIEIPIGL